MNTIDSSLSCGGCGANLEYAPGEMALKCKYCSTITEIAQEENELDEIPELVIPLAVEKGALEQAVYQHLASGHYTPDDLIERAVLTKVERFYTPAYLFSGEYEAKWTASFGYDRTEHYTAYETKHENGRSRQVPVTKTKTVTDWNPVNGTDAGSFSVLAYAGSKLNKRVMPLIEHPVGCKAATVYDVSFVSGLDVEPFSVTEEAAYSKRGDPQINETIDENVRKHAQGDRQRDWHWTADIHKEGTPVIVPLCHVTYEYEGKSYDVWADGTDPQIQITDDLPKDEKRQKNVRVGFLPAAAATVALLIAGLASDDSGLFSAISTSTFFLLAAAWSYAFWRRHTILNYSVNLRKSLLAQKTASTANLVELDTNTGSTLGDSFTAPEKPWVLNTEKDRRALLASTAVFCGAIFLVTFGDKINFKSSATSVAVNEVVKTAPPEETPASQASQPAAVTQEVVTTSPSQVSTPAPLQDNSSISGQVAGDVSSSGVSSAASTSVDSPTTSPEGAQSESASEQIKPMPNEAPSPNGDSKKADVLLAILQSAAKADWTGVDEQVQQLKLSSPLIRGDRKAARSANVEGLNALQQHDTAMAVAAFAKGVRYDMSDIEVKNNLGYAYLQAGDVKSAVETLTDVLALAPDRSSAWANMADALAQSGQQSAAEASLRLTIRYSSSRAKTIDFLNKVSEGNFSTKFKEVAARVLKEVDSIPQSSQVAPSAALSTQPTSTQISR